MCVTVSTMILFCCKLDFILLRVDIYQKLNAFFHQIGQHTVTSEFPIAKYHYCFNVHCMFLNFEEKNLCYSWK